MCGIAGLVCFDPNCGGAGHEALVQRMCDLQVHRGPDDGGVACHGRVGLGTRRLSIIDLSPAGHMPMSDESGRWWITLPRSVEFRSSPCLIAPRRSR